MPCKSPNPPELRERAVRMVGEHRLAREVLRRPIEPTQCASRTYRARLAAHGMVASMSGTGDCHDTAVAESFFARREFELVMQNDWQARDEARRAVFQYSETWYNPTRRHSTLGYVRPAAYEAQGQAAA